MTTAIIIDREINSANYLKGLMKTILPEVSVKSIVGSLSEGLRLLDEFEPSLVFVDMQLQTANGFDLIDQFSENNYAVIFTMPRVQSATSTVKFSPPDFLLTPFEPEDLKSAVDSAMQKFNEYTLNKNRIVVSQALVEQNEQRRIAVSTSSNIIVIDVENILYLQSDGPYTNIHTKNAGKVMSSKHLKEYEDTLTEFGFFRIHKSYLVNLEEIKQYSKTEGGFVVLTSGDKVAVSDKKKSGFMSNLSSNIIFVR
jgi:two-component system LytT family response regulator